jgi:hypothetical protein
LPGKLWSDSPDALPACCRHQRAVGLPSRVDSPVSGYFTVGYRRSGGPVSGLPGSAFLQIVQAGHGKCLCTDGGTSSSNCRRQGRSSPSPNNCSCAGRRLRVSGQSDAVCQDEFGQYWAALLPRQPDRGLYSRYLHHGDHPRPAFPWLLFPSAQELDGGRL